MTDINQKLPYHSFDADKCIEKLNSSENGLQKEEVKKRVEQFGPNELQEKERTSILQLIIKQFKDFLVLILIVAAVIAFLSGKMIDVYVIIAVIIVNAAIGFFQEYKAEKSVAALKKLIKHDATVIRDGEEYVIPATKLVPGDVIRIDEGKSVPADARLLEIKNFRAVEASLTGESLPIDKKTDKLEEDTPLADRKNMIFKGTHIARGSAKAIVTATGQETELGKIAESLQEVEEEESEFRKKTRKLAKIMAVIAGSAAAIVFVIGYFFRDFEFSDILMVTIAVLVSAVPEGLPAVLSIVLAIGANRMAKRNAIIREFTATETAGSLTVVLSDKTGTITQSVLTVKKLFLPDGNVFDVSGSGYKTEGDIKSEKDEEPGKIKDNELLRKIALIGNICNNATIAKPEKEDEKEEKNGEKEPEVSGDPTEVSLLVFSKKTGIEEDEEFNEIQIIDDLPFNSEQKFRATLVEYPENRKEIMVVGAPEKLLDLSTKIVSADNGEDMTDETRDKIKGKIDEFTKNAMRVLACAFVEAGQDKESVSPEDIENLVFTGLFGIIDPPRPEIKEAVADCKSAGIRVIMVTGDHKQTAAAIAREVGILSDEQKDSDTPEVLTEKDLDVDDETFSKYTGQVNVFARVSPRTKLRIAESIQKKNQLIGMTGDGVNDAPALKTADLGIAMGQRGTDVAKDASQIVLSDDNFASIVNAIKEGRIVFRNVRITSFFLITTNVAQATTIVTAIAIGFTYPLLPTQILWINMITDGIMDISLATEPDHHGDIMKEKPKKKGAPILSKEIFPFLFIIAPVMVVLALLTFNHYLPQGVEKARTGVFLIIAMMQIFNAFNMRSLKHSAFKIGIFKNKWVNIAFIVSVVLQLGAIKVSFIQDIFHFRDLAWLDIAVITALSSLIFVAGELYKLIRHKIKSG